MTNRKYVLVDKVRDKRIYDEIIVDCYDEIEQMMGWQCYLDETLKFPFLAKCIKKQGVSPLEIGEVVEVISVGENCENDMLVNIHWSGRKFEVPLSQLQPMNATKKVKQVFDDWRYWSQYL